jgi:hypothetical protein
MATCVFADSQTTELNAVIKPHFKKRQLDRIAAALGLSGGPLPEVDNETLSRYYQYLSANLTFPFAAHYPEPTNSREEIEFCCTVLELLDPSKHVGDMFDGIFCKTRKGKYEVNLPLIELDVVHDSPNLHLIEDFWYWFWNYR